MLVMFVKRPPSPFHYVTEWCQHWPVELVRRRTRLRDALVLSGMDMNRPLPEDSVLRAGQSADEARTSKPDGVRQGAELDPRRDFGPDVRAGLEFVLRHDAGLLKRLEEA